MQQKSAAKATARVLVRTRDDRSLLRVMFAVLVLISVLWLIFATAVQAQDYQFSDVRVEGNQRVDSGTVLR